MSDFFNEHTGEIFALINAILVMFILPMVNKWLNEHLNSTRAARVETAIAAGLQSAIAALTIGKNSKETIISVLNNPDVRNNVIDLARDYVHETVPQTVDKLGIDPALEKIISARVEAAIAALAENYIIANNAIESANRTEMSAVKAGMQTASV